MAKGISIIICCYNSETRIIPTLEHLKQQQCADSIMWEVIVIDNASTDNTSGISKSYWNDYPIPIKVIKEEKPGLSFARETGFANASYDLVCLVDDDNWVNPLWISTIYNIMDQNPDIGACGGRGEAVFESDSPSWFDKYQYAYAVGPQKSILSNDKDQIPFLYGAGLTIRKTVLEELKKRGFKSLLSDRKGSALTSGGDFELTLAIQLAGYKLHYEDKLTFKHYMTSGRLTWEYLKKLYFSFGKASVLTDIYKSELKKLKGFDRSRITNPNISLIYSYYLILKYYPKILFLKATNQWRTGCHEILGHDWRKGKLAAHKEIYFLLPQIVDQVKNAPWLKTKP